MSETYFINCLKCKRSLWIGQSCYIYTDEKHTMEALKKFLYKHLEHPLMFVSSNYNDYLFDTDDKWKRIKVKRRGGFS